MDLINNLINLLDPMTIIKTVGLLGVFFIVFAESGLFFGFFLPGDSLLFTAGFLASQNFLNINFLFWGSFICAILGDSVGYWFGRKVGPKIFNKEDSIFFQKKHIERAQNFYNKHGNKTIFLARFIPIIRTFAPIVAGIGNMNYKNFVTYNIVGAFVWSFSTVFSGYFLGQIIPGVDKYLLPIILVIIVISFLPIVFETLKARSKK
ncbi:MAG: VTT domain-containing protein [Candidatus Paceibacterota bacterium]|jgi:membrane-associated protein